MKSVLKNMPNWLKIALVVVMIVGVVLTIMNLKKIKDRVQRNSAIRDFETDQKQWENKGENPSYNDLIYEEMASKIWNACDQWGTDETEILNQFKRLNNNVDFLKLQAAYGTDSDDETLDSQLRDELDSDEISNINSLLRSKGISYTI